MQRCTTKSLGSIASVIRGVTFDKSEASTDVKKSFLPVLRAGNIQNTLLIESDLIYVPETLVSDTQRIKRGDLAICMSSGSAALVGKTAYAESDWNGSVGA